MQHIHADKGQAKADQRDQSESPARLLMRPLTGKCVTAVQHIGNQPARHIAHKRGGDRRPVKALYKADQGPIMRYGGQNTNQNESRELTMQCHCTGMTMRMSVRKSPQPPSGGSHRLLSELIRARIRAGALPARSPHQGSGLRRVFNPARDFQLGKGFRKDALRLLGVRARPFCARHRRPKQSQAPQSWTDGRSCRNGLTYLQS